MGGCELIFNFLKKGIWGGERSGWVCDGWGRSGLSVLKGQ